MALKNIDKKKIKTTEQVVIKKTKKNENAGKHVVLKKRKKSVEEEEEDEELKEPTQAELLECMKPENILDIETVREKKQKKHKANIELKKNSSEDREKVLIKIYLNAWKEDKDNWKFEKLRQILIQNNLYNEDKISDELFPIAIEYLSGTKGKAKDLLIEKAESIINEIDEISTEKEESTLKKYQRARELLQILQ